MKHLAILMLGFAFGTTAIAQDLDAYQEAVIKAEAQRHVELYYNFYYERDPESLSTEIFTLPWFTFAANGIVARSTVAENREFFSSAIQGLLDRGWNRSIFTTKNVCVLGAGSAIVSGTNTRTRADGSIMSVGGVSYFLGTTDEGWRINSFASHPPDRIVTCPAQ